MVDIITPANRILYQDKLDEMFRLRYEVAVTYLKWPLPDAKDGYDVDQFDRDDTIYLIDYSKTGRVIACARLNPTTKPTLLTEVFEGYCSFSPNPVGDNIYELSRFLVTKRGLTQAEFSKARTNIMLAVNEFCVAYGIQKLSFLTYLDNYTIAALVWDTLPLGVPKLYEPDNTEYIAALSTLNEKTLQRSRRIAGVREQVSNLIVPINCARILTDVEVFKKAS